tara:strand:+ start:53 stop:619 length:567 start_codon:yes stop_codon:yes gene_type:complete
MKKKILFLGYSSKETKIIDFLKKKNLSVTTIGNKKVNLKLLKKFHLCLSFGYRKIIGKEIISNLKRPIINLHISYLPYNKGSHPNYWSFVKKTPKGVTIHEMDKGIDTGKIVVQKKVKFRITKKTTFRDTYYKLRNEIEKLFIKNYKKIILLKYKSKKQKKIKFSKNKKISNNFNWNIPITKHLKNNT